MKGCRPLTEDEINKITKSFTGKYALRDKALFLLGVKSGFRISELLSLRILDIYQHERFVNKVTVERKNMKKKIEGRTVLLHPVAKKALEGLLKQLKKEGYKDESFVFQGRKGQNKPVSRIHGWRILQNAFSKNRLTGKLGTHCMRKSFADQVYEKLNHDLIKTRKALGHKNINSTISYLSFREEDIDEAILAL